MWFSPYLLIAFLFVLKCCYSEICTNTEDVANCRKKTLAFEAISDLHSQLDGDSSGGVDFSEASRFLGDKLSYPVEHFRQTDLSQEDGIISLLDLWVAWQKNPAHNWTVAETARWVSESVELPEYGEIFQQYKVDGESIPRLVSRSPKFISDELGIKNSLHRRKLSLKAMDLILFGPPKKNFSSATVASSLVAHLAKDMPLLTTLALAGAFFVAFFGLNYHYSRRLRTAASGNYDRLFKAEQTLQELQHELLRLKEVEPPMCNSRRSGNGRSAPIDDEVVFRHSDSGRSSDQASLISAKQSRTEPPTRKPSESSSFHRRTVADSPANGYWPSSPLVASPFYIGGSERVSAASVVTTAKRPTSLNSCPPIDCPATELALLLQLTHEFELRHYWEKRSAAARQLMAAKEACDRVRRKRSTFVGSVRLIHSDNLDDVDSKLSAARRVLENVTADMHERKYRWSRIEELTGMLLQQPTDINVLMTALGYENPKGRLAGEGSNSSLRLYDLSAEFSLFTGDDFVDDQPSSCFRSFTTGATEDWHNRQTSDWQNKCARQSLSRKHRPDASPAEEAQYAQPDARSDRSPPARENSSGLFIQPTLTRNNYSFVRPFAALWRRKAKSHTRQLPSCFGPPTAVPHIRPQFSIDTGTGPTNYDSYQRKPFIS
uniref:SOAR domain-containing protein n=1 Tax=Mesocestoides corti TaxID=53468 RepID=A0A5K3EYD4_MESCO